MSKKIIFIQNIITSYRIDLFNEIYYQTKKRADDFEVFYYRESYSWRYLPFDKSNIIYPYTIFKGIYFRIKSQKIHINPYLVWKVARQDRSVKVVMGASWNDVNVILILLMKRMGLVSCELFLWSEANYMSKGARKRGKFKKLLRGFIFNSIDKGVIIPGKIAKETITKEWGFSNRLYFLPNLVDGEYYHHFRIKPSGDKLRLVTIARLEESDKGLVNFIIRAGKEELSKFNWVIAGDGPDKKKIQTLINYYELSANIILVGNLPKDKVKTLYKDSDIFLLPSLSDPNPLTVIEALHSGLPLMLSRRCGNVYEAVEDEVNGKIFDPNNDESIKCAIHFFLDKKMFIDALSNESKRIADKNFNLKLGVKSFLVQMES